MDHHSALIRLPLAGQQLVGLDHQCSLKKQQKPLVVVSADGAAGPSQQPFDAVNFPIDDLLDFSNEDIAGPIGEEAAADHQLQLAAASSFTAVVPSVTKVETITCLQAAALASSSSSSSSSSVEKGSTELEHLHIDSELPQLEEEGTAAAASIEEADLCVPYIEELEELEWASRLFLEASFTVSDDSSCRRTWSNDCSSVISIEERESEISALFNTPGYDKAAASPLSVLDQQTSATSSELTGSELHSLDFCVPARARSKRSRNGGKIWMSGILSCTTTTSCGTSARISAATSQCSAQQDTVEEGEEWQSFYSQRAKQSRKLSASQQGGGEILQCQHCQTQKTPQWRIGPMGPKTLCNACGVRYKSGRLLPEYRPAASPAYIARKHSNSHKKILEMRRQRELMGASPA
ncbi:unnamed protein product [Sphagnum jensenii]|uniref:GATA-type domain-containing protein n=1 Tax=Sphagnum jensenii TaxID=128206 RepID=A0ABP1BPX7_9BRYO